MADPKSGLTIVAAGRLDNSAELKEELRVPPSERASLSESDLFLRAYQQWGEACPEHLFGDWAFAVWHPDEQRLFLARDHHGRTALYYYSDPSVFAFATTTKALLTLNLAPHAMDELYLAQTLVAWNARHGERTIYASLRRLPPAHCLSVQPDRLDVRRYWRLEDTPELRLPRRQDYVEAFREVFDAAVRANLRSGESMSERDNEAHPSAEIAVSLSGGLDSSAVAATAAKLLQERDVCLTAFTSVPLYDTEMFVGQRFGDEWPLAQEVCRFAGNIDLHPVKGETVTPIQAIRRMLEVFGEPGHAASNYYWILELEKAAHAQGCRVLLSGQAGNAGISWRGDPFSQPLAFQLRRMGARRWLSERFHRVAPHGVLAAWRRGHIAEKEWVRASAIHPDFARRLGLFDQWLTDPQVQPARSAREQRFRTLMPGRSPTGALHAQLSAAQGLEIRDPTADARLLAFVISVPDSIFIDPDTGLDRWLIRAAMENRVPDAVRLNRRRGRQAGDLVPRLRACAAEVAIALDELESGSAAQYVDVPYMREAWKIVQECDASEALQKADTILTRGIMAGLFVNGFTR